MSTYVVTLEVEVKGKDMVEATMRLGRKLDGWADLVRIIDLKAKEAGNE